MPSRHEILSPLPPVNPGEMHVPCVLLVDNSDSLNCKGPNGRVPIDELNDGLVAFRKALDDNPLALGRADISIITFNSTVQTQLPFAPAANYVAPTLTASGCTAMNQGILTALDAIEARKSEYKNLGIPYYRPCLFLLTDGLPTDGRYESEAKRRLHEALQNKKLNFFPMGVGNADIAHLKSYTADGSGRVLKASATHFKEAFVWVSNSIGLVVNSDPRLGTVNLEPTPSNVALL